MPSYRTLREPAVPARASASRPGTDARRRNGESLRTWFRSDRVFNQDGAWYIATREGINIGPYSTRVQAERDVDALIEHLSQRGTGLAVQDDALTIRQFVQRPLGRSIR